MPGDPRPIELSAREARRAALAAQGFARPRPGGRVDARHLRRVIDDVGLLQLDSVNVLSRAHYLPFFSRLGPYPRATLDRLCAHGDGAGRAPKPAARELFEYWGHEASLLPVDLQPLMRWRMARVDDLAWGSISRIGREQPRLVEQVLEVVAEKGPVRASEIELRPAARARGGEMWDWSETKKALEHLFFGGRVAAARRINFERLYDLPERVLPPAILDAPTPPEDEAQRQLLLIAARRLGVATEPDLGDYFRLPRRESKARVAELVEAGELAPVRVEGWGPEAYAPRDLAVPRRVRRRALLSPFDSLVWARPRTERLWDFHYRIEIYTPAHKRVHGYYVLPFLLGDRLVARVDLKADRQAGALRVRGAYLEPGAGDAGAVAPELAAELRALADWLELGTLGVERRGDLAQQLSRAVAANPPA